MANGDMWGMGDDDLWGQGGPAPIDSGAYGLGGAPTVGQTFVGDPSGLWRTARVQQMGARAALPQFARTAMQGFTPAFGGYLLGGTGGSFEDYMRNQYGGGPGSAVLPTGGAATPTAFGDNWARAVAASRATNPYLNAGTLSPDEFARQTTLQGYMTGPNARANQLAMAQSAMGGGVGYAAQARQRALGNLYDLYAARAGARGMEGGGFLGYLGGRMGTDVTGILQSGVPRQGGGNGNGGGNDTTTGTWPNNISAEMLRQQQRVGLKPDPNKPNLWIKINPDEGD